MTKTPEISVIMSVYNGEDYLAEAIESVCNQTFKNWELIVINDCSNDSTGQILSEFEARDERVKVHTNEVNLRLPKSLNKALSLAKGKYVARMDADDICISTRLQTQFDFMESHPDVSLSSCRFLTIKNGVLSSGGCGLRNDSESLKALLLVTNPILHPGIIARSEDIKKLEYDTTLTCTEDLELWTRMVANGMKLEILPEYLMVYRLHDKQITETTRDRQCKEVVKIQKTYFSHLLEPMDEKTEEFYINGVYFRQKTDASMLCNFFRYLKRINRKKQLLKNEALEYALFEIAAEYKRSGISKKDLVKILSSFNPIFLLKELADRKKRARLDGEKCITEANKLGYAHTSGNTEFPIFSKSEQR